VDYPATLILPEPGLFRTEQELCERVLGLLDHWYEIEREVTGRYWNGTRVRIDAVLRPRDPAPWADEQPAFGVEFKLPARDVGEGEYFQWAAQAVDYTHVEWHGCGRLQVFLCPSPALAVLRTAAQIAEGREWRRKFASDQEAERSQRYWAEIMPEAGRELSPEQRALDSRRWWRELGQGGGVAEAKARDEGFENAFERSVRQAIVTARSMMHLLGQLNVGELTPVHQHGWALLRAGHVLWSQEQGVRNRWSLRPGLASRRTASPRR
jgi:hypothetical protein